LSFKLYRGDCLKVLKRIDTGSIDAVVTDPPYGVDLSPDYTRYSTNTPSRSRGKFRRIIGDNEPFDPSPFLGFPKVCLWGANFYSDSLPGGGWQVWIKKPDKQFGKFLGDAEVAWVKGGKAVYLFRHRWAGAVRETERGPTLHSTQKPIALMRWCIERLKLKPGSTILDPYMGSGPVGIAAVQLGMNYIGVEIDPAYFAIAKQRITAACPDAQTMTVPASTRTTTSARTGTTSRHS
jgi:site-specific DNA-methyltransferase (adenine-specific)